MSTSADMAERHARLLADYAEIAAAAARRLVRRPSPITRLIRHEAEDAEAADWLIEAAEERIALQSLEDDFASQPLDDHIEELAEALDLSPAAARAWRDLPDPATEPASEPEVRSSA